jgi:hypothetical protein
VMIDLDAIRLAMADEGKPFVRSVHPILDR